MRNYRRLVSSGDGGPEHNPIRGRVHAQDERKLPTFKSLRTLRQEIWWEKGWIWFACDVVQLGDLGQLDLVKSLTASARRWLSSRIVPDKDLCRLIQWAVAESKERVKVNPNSKSGAADALTKSTSTPSTTKSIDDTRCDNNRKRVAKDLKYIGRKQLRTDTKRQIEQCIGSTTMSRKQPRFMHKSDNGDF